MKLGIRGCLLNFRGTVEGHRVAEKGDKFELSQEITENKLIKRVPGITCERQTEHTMGCILMSLEEDAQPSCWCLVSALPRASGIPPTTSTVLPQLLYVLLVMVVTCHSLQKIVLEPVEPPRNTYRLMFSQRQPQPIHGWCRNMKISLTSSGKRQSLVYMPEFSCGIKLKRSFLLCSKSSLCLASSPFWSCFSHFLTSFSLKHLSKSLALEFLSQGKLLGDLTQDSLLLMVDQQQHVLSGAEDAIESSQGTC